MASANGNQSRRGPSAWSDVRYVDIAVAYVTRLEQGSRHAVADVAAASRGTLSAAQVRDAIHTARRRGLLTPATQQGARGRTTDAAGGDSARGTDPKKSHAKVR